MLDLDHFRVLPSSPVSPLELYITNKKTLPPRTGVVLLAHGNEEPVLVNAAKLAFFPAES